MKEHLIDSDFTDALSPFNEAAAYEALWDEEGATVKKIAELFFPKTQDISSPFISHLSENIKNTDFYKQTLFKILKSLSLKNFHLDICCLGAMDFPKKLLDAKYPIPLLYFSGAWDLIFSPSVAVVGTRSPTPEGIKRTQKLVKELINDNFVIVSGLAKGIDTVAHQTAIFNKKPTIGVIGTPLSEYYPKENKLLQDEIAKNHLLISQVPFIRYRKQTYQTNRFFFPERNKTMSALSLATIIVEAGESSGALIQAKAALEQKRKLFILENCFQNKDLTWPSKFEKDGAIRVREYSDIKKVLESL